MSQTKRKFLGKPLRIAAVQYGQRPEDTLKVPAILEKGGFNTEQLLHAIGREGYGLYDKAEHAELIRKYAAECARRGIGIILYANAHMVPPGAVRDHPEWAQAGADGKLSGFACVNSPWRDAFFQCVRDSLEQDIRGIFLDGPIFIREGCRCARCRKLFSEEFGHPIDSASRGELSRFKSEHIARFVKDVRDVIRASGKDVALYANCLGLVENITGCTVDAVFPYVDLIGSEGGFLFYGNPNEVSVWHGSETAKYLEAKSQGKPYVIFNAGNHQPWAREMHTVPETTLLYASTVANGGNVWYGIHGLIDGFRTPSGQAAFRFNRFLAENEEFFTGTEQQAGVALLWSHRTADNFPGETAETDFTKAAGDSGPRAAGSFQKEFHGISEILFRSHIQFSILDEACVRGGDLKKFRTLILPNASCLDDAEIEAIGSFVRAGGCLIATLESGGRDAQGNPRAASPLRKLLGIRRVERTVLYRPGCGYMRFEGERPLVQSGSGEASAGFTTGTLRCAYAGDARVLASSYEPMESRYGAFNEKKYPCITVRKAGLGTAVYIAGGIGQTYLDYGIPEMEEAVRALVRRLTPGDLQVERAFPSVEVELRLQPGRNRRLIHFANHTGAMRRPIGELIPCRGIRVSLKAEKPVRRVRSLFRPKEIPFVREGDWIRFSVDVEDYELVAVEETPAEGRPDLQNVQG